MLPNGPKARKNVAQRVSAGLEYKTDSAPEARKSLSNPPLRPSGAGFVSAQHSQRLRAGLHSFGPPARCKPRLANAAATVPGGVYKTQLPAQRRERFEEPRSPRDIY